MAIDYAVKYSGKVDERFKVEAKSEPCINKDYDFVGAKTVKVYTVSTSAMGDYTRSGTSRYGTPAELDATTQEMVMSQDRSFTFTIDKMNEDETMGALNAGKALARQIREVIIPEVDAYRFAKMATGAGKKATPLALTKDNIYASIVAGSTWLDDKEVPFVGRYLVVTPATFALMKQSKDIVLDTEVGQEMRIRGVIATYDGMPVIQVPSSRMPVSTGFLIGHSVATTAPVKLAEYKVHEDAPGISGSLVEGRVYYDAFVLDNKKDAIYFHAIA